METNQNLISTELHIDPSGYVHLKETAMWAKFLAIVGLVLSVLLLIVAVFAGTFMANINDTYGAQASFMSAGIISAIYIIIGLIYFFLSLFLLRFAVNMKNALQSNDQGNLNSSFLNLKLVYRILGIITLIYIGFMVLGLIIMVIGMAAM